VLPLNGPHAYAPVLACRDRAVRVLDADGGAPLFEVPTPSPPTCLLHVPDAHDPRRRRDGWGVGLGGPGAAAVCSQRVAACLLESLCPVRPQCVRSLCLTPTFHLLRLPPRFPEGSLELLYGCEDGRVVQLMVERGAVRQGFTVPPPPGGGEVRALHCGADYSKASHGGRVGTGRCDCTPATKSLPLSKHGR
jgi:hypothetical protein